MMRLGLSLLLCGVRGYCSIRAALGRLTRLFAF
jgi:hypothetical protein